MAGTVYEIDWHAEAKRLAEEAWQQAVALRRAEVTRLTEAWQARWAKANEA